MFSKNKLFFLIILVFFYNCTTDKNKNTQTTPNIIIDSVYTYLKLSKDKVLDISTRKLFLEKAYKNVTTRKDDTIKNQLLHKIAYRYIILKDTIQFKKINKEALVSAKFQKDSLSLAEIYWNYAHYYHKKENYPKAYENYFKALKYYEGKKEVYKSGRMLYEMAFIKGRFNDYWASEDLNIRAIKKFKKILHYKYLHISYNHLAILQGEVGEYDRALFYYNKALEYLSKTNDTDMNYEGILNNIGNIYRKKGNYKKAIEYYEKAINSKRIKKNTSKFARFIDNRAYSKLCIGDTTDEIKEEFLTSLRIRDSIGEFADVIVVKIHLTEYFKKKKDTVNALLFGKEANSLAKKVKNNGSYLRSLILLSTIDRKNANFFLNTHIKYKDSLEKIERKFSRKFTRIDFETDEYVAENKLLFQQKIWIISFSGAILLIFSLLYFLKNQKLKTEKLYAEAERQKASEEIYILSQQQQHKLEEGKIKERNRISEELHDGILGKLFGVRLGLGFLNLKNTETNNKLDSCVYELQEIEKEIRSISHDLKNHLTPIKMNFITLVFQYIKNSCSLIDLTHEINSDKKIIWDEVNDVIKINLFRIIQEIVQNTIKHADAKKLIINFTLQENTIDLLIKDNGCGFSITNIKEGIGLKNIKSRIKKIDGTIKIISKVSKGTVFKISIPII